jgi:hypothetical protein
MSNLITGYHNQVFEYYFQKSCSPAYYHRQYDQYLPKTIFGSEKNSRLIANSLPLAEGLFKASRPIVPLLDGCKIFSHLRESYQSRGVLSKMASIFKLVFSLGCMYGYYYPLGRPGIYSIRPPLFIGTICDIAYNAVNLSQNHSKETSLKITIHVIENLGSLLYLGTFFTPSYNLRVLGALTHGTACLIGARELYQEKDYLNAAVKALVVAYFFYQSYQLYCTSYAVKGILNKYPILAKNLLNEKNLYHLWGHPLLNYVRRSPGHRPYFFFKNRPYFFFKNRFYDLGKNFFGYGKGLIKGMNLQFKSGKTRILEFKLNHVFREKLQGAIEELQNIPKSDQKLLLSWRGSDAREIVIEKVPEYLDGKYRVGISYKIAIPDLGAVFVGASKVYPTLYNRVQVHVHHTRGLYDFHKLLSFVGLEETFQHSMNMDIERMKLGHLFRVFSPRQATLLERSTRFFDLPVDQLRQEMIRLDPKMETIFKDFLPKMELGEIVNGRKRFVIKGLADELRKRGAKELTSALTGTYGSEESLDRVASIVQMGMLSSELRFNGGFPIKGLSTTADFETGGCDSVFTQLATKSSPGYSHFGYGGEIRFIFSLDALETGSYQYHYDEFGVKNMFSFMRDIYLSRPDIFSFVQEEVKRFGKGNELMVKERLSPDFITGIIVRSEKMKIELIKKLREYHLVRMGLDGQEWVNRVPLSKLIRVDKNT